MRVCHAIIAVVASVAAAYRSPLFGAHRRLRGALSRAGSFATILRLRVFAEESLNTARRRAALTTRPSSGGSRGRGAFTRMPRRHAMGVCHADVHVGSTVAPADRAVVLRAGARHGEARTFGAALATFGARSVVADEACFAGIARGAAALASGPIRVARRFGRFRARSEEQQKQQGEYRSRHAPLVSPKGVRSKVPQRAGSASTRCGTHSPAVPCRNAPRPERRTISLNEFGSRFTTNIGTPR